MLRVMAVLLAALLPLEVSAATVWFVRNSATAGGNGTRNSPFNQLAAAEVQSQPGDTIFLFAGDQNAGVTLKDGQSLIGEGVALVINGVTVVPAGTKPTITNRSGPAIRLANNNTVRGLTIADSKEQGMVGQAKTSGLTIDNVSVLRSGTEAILLADASGAISIDTSQFDTAPGDLVRIGSNSNLALQVTNSRFTRNGNDALRLVGGGSGFLRVVARGNTLERVTGDGIDITGRGVADDAYSLSADIADNRFADAQQTGANAIAIKAQSRESFTIDVARNTLTLVGGTGAIAVTADDSARVRGRIAENQIVGAAANGIDIQADETTDVALDIDANTIRQSARHGISAIGFPGTARINLAIRNNHVALSQRDGIMLALYGGSMLATIAGNDVTAPVGVGFLLTNFSPGVFMLEGDPTRTAQENLQRSNSGSAGIAGVVSVIRGRQHVVHH